MRELDLGYSKHSHNVMPVVTDCMRAVLYSPIYASSFLRVRFIHHLARKYASTAQIYTTKRTLSHASSQASSFTRNRVALAQSCLAVDNCISHFLRNYVTTCGLNRGIKSVTTRSITSRPSDHDPESKWHHVERHIHVGGSGSVRLDIYNLSQSHQLETDISSGTSTAEKSQSMFRRNNIIIYLPPGPLPSGVDVSDQCFEELLAMGAGQTKSCAPTIIKINYRLHPWSGKNNEVDDFRFPIAIHDTATCFDWISEHLDSLVLSRGSQRSTSSNDEDLDIDDIQISICGSHIGGTLALTTALTNPNDIHCVAVIDPVIDWAGLDELAAAVDEFNNVDTDDTSQTRRKRRLRSTIDAKSSPCLDPERVAARAMIDLRTSLFHTPSAFFDPFASPILFLRAPGKDTPLWRNARPEADLRELEEDTMTGFGPYDDDWHTVNDGREGMYTDNAGVHDDAYLDTLTKAIGADTISSPNSTLIYSTETPDVQAENSPPFPAVQVATDLSDLSTTITSPSAYGINELSVDERSGSQAPTDLSNLNRDPSISSSDEILDAQNIRTPKRRKVLRRWPPVAQPEEVLLPHVRVFRRLPSFGQTNKSDHTRSVREIDLAHVLHPQAKEMVDVMRRACFWGREKSLAEERVTIEVLNERKGAAGDQVESRDTDKVCTWLSSKINEDRG